MLKAKYEPTKRMEARKLENQLSYIYDTLGETMFRQAVQDILLNGSCKSLGYIAPGYLPQRKLFDEMYYRTITEWGGGYPRPAIEMLDCKWNADSKKNPNPSPASFILMKPDLDVAELLYEK
jgi:hypothetical protein